MTSARDAVIHDIRQLLSGTQPLANSAEVESANAHSRSQKFAAGEDVNLALPILSALVSGACLVVLAGGAE